MKKLLITILFFQLVIMTGSCQKPKPPVLPVRPTPEQPIEEPINYTELSIVWRSTYTASANMLGFHDLFFAGDYIVLSSIGDDNVKCPAADIRVFHKLTGNLHPAWTHEAGSLYDRRKIDDCIVGGNNHNTIFATNQLETYAFDIQTGKRLWKKSFYPIYGYNRLSTMGNYLLQTYGPSSMLWGRVATFDYLTGQERMITQIDISDNFEFQICPPAWTTNAAGDTLLLFSIVGINFATNQRLIDAYCYNVSQNKMEWHQKNLTPDGMSNGSIFVPLIIDNNKVIFEGTMSIHCFDISTGKLFWQYDMSWRDAYATPFLYYKGKLLVRGGRGDIFCYDVQTGALLWQNTTIKAEPSAWGNKMDAYNDKLYLTASTNLYCVSIATGNVEWEVPNATRGSVLIDQQTGYLYCHAGWTILCVDLNKTPKK